MNFDKALEVFELKSLEKVDIKELKSLYRSLAKTKHPDQGGETLDFVELKNAYTLLQESLKSEKNNGTDLQVLSKEEILNKYYKDTSELKLKLENFELSFEAQQETLTQTKHRVKNLSKDFDRRKHDLQKELEHRLSNLEKGYTKNLLQKILFFLPSMSEDEFWRKYHSLVNHFSNKMSDLDSQFFKEMLEIYGDSLNAVSKVVNKF